MDHPTERSSHSAPVPRGGGIAPAFGSLLAVIVTPSVQESDRLAVVVAATVFGLIGLVDDMTGIRALHRLAVQFVASALFWALLSDDLTGPMPWRGLLVLGAVVWLVAFVNAYNFMDGVNGISVVQAVAAGAIWFIVGTMTETSVLTAGGAIIGAAALGFAPFNVPTARMFLGDVGSYFVGAWLAVVAVLALRADVPPEAVLAPLALYAADTGTTLARRVLRGERWYLSHRDHTYQRLVDAGWSHVRISAYVGACITICGALGVASVGESVLARAAADVAIAGVVGAYLLTPRWLTSRHSVTSDMNPADLSSQLQDDQLRWQSDAS